jgi:intracellular sulfur oxidation DsrE/DsrF family protein
MALQKLIERGVKVAACDMALAFYSGLVAKQMSLKAEDVLKDWNAAILPGITHAPSGVVAVQGAVAHGCSYIFAG